jgi:branched-chain amino acid transport system permease protein
MHRILSPAAGGSRQEDDRVFLDLLVNGFFRGVPIAVAALGFALIWYTSKEFHFLYGTMLAASGYGVYSLAEAGLDLTLSFLTVMVLAALVGGVLKHQFYRRLGSPLSVLMFSFGLAIVVQNILQIIYGPSDVVLTNNGLAEQSVQVLPWADITRQANDLLSLAVLVVVWIALAIVMQRTDFGLAVQSVMTDPEAAQYVGVKPDRIRWMAYALGSAIGALAGALSMLGQGVRPTTGFDVMLFAFMATFLGGGVLVRVPWWGLLTGIALSLVAWQLPTNLSTLIVFALMLTYVITRRHFQRARETLSSWSAARSGPAEEKAAVG